MVTLIFASFELAIAGVKAGWQSQDRRKVPRTVVRISSPNKEGKTEVAVPITKLRSFRALLRRQNITYSVE